jgi:hypothetical protein
MMTIPKIEEWFDKARMQAAQRNLVIIRTDGELLILPALARASVKPEMVAAVERMMPSTTKRNVAVIGDTSWATSTSPSLQVANQAIPFFGLLMGLASIGHAVWVFSGALNLISAGCRDADVLVVDSASIATLPNNWQGEAATVMRNPQILVHDRASYQLLRPQPDKTWRGLQ